MLPLYLYIGFSRVYGISSVWGVLGFNRCFPRVSACFFLCSRVF